MGFVNYAIGELADAVWGSLVCLGLNRVAFGSHVDPSRE